jgi:hypothetical protein
VRLRLVSEVCPDYSTLLSSTGPALEPARFGRRASPGIRNLRTGRVLVSHASRAASVPAAFQPGVLAWELTQTFSFLIEPGQSEMIILRLSLYPDA